MSTQVPSWGGCFSEDSHQDRDPFAHKESPPNILQALLTMLRSHPTFPLLYHISRNHLLINSHNLFITMIKYLVLGTYKEIKFIQIRVLDQKPHGDSFCKIQQLHGGGTHERERPHLQLGSQEAIQGQVQAFITICFCGNKVKEKLSQSLPKTDLLMAQGHPKDQTSPFTGSRICCIFTQIRISTHKSWGDKLYPNHSTPKS